MGEWLAELSEQELISVSVEWKLTDETRKRLQKEIRGEAVANARELAEDYARGDGVVIDAAHRMALLSVSDNDSHYGGPSPLRGASAMKAGSAAPVAAMSPEEIRVSANITALFDL